MNKEGIIHEREWVTLALTLGARSTAFRRLIEVFSSPEGIFSATDEALCHTVPRLGKATSAALRGRSLGREADRIVTWCHRNGVEILTYGSAKYPARLREMEDPPIVLYCRGKLPAMDDCITVGVVGTRKADAYGEQVAYKLSFELAAAGAVIVSGMAEGLDGMAAAAALNAGGSTVAVLGCGIDVVYPRKHTKLAREIAQRGAILTEYPPGTRPLGHHFPVRNRIISALSGAVLVVEAGEKSGALITARYAVLQGKELFAVPGDVTSERSVGTNTLLADGASFALQAEDVLSHFRFLYHDAINEQALFEAVQYSTLTEEALRPFGLRAHKKERSGGKTPPAPDRQTAVPDASPKADGLCAPDLSALNARQRELYALLPGGPFSPDIFGAAGVAVSEGISALTVFEIYGLVISLPGGMYQKAK